jgi:hypothetical protein
LVDVSWTVDALFDDVLEVEDRRAKAWLDECGVMNCTWRWPTAGCGNLCRCLGLAIFGRTRSWRIPLAAFIFTERQCDWLWWRLGRYMKLKQLAADL